MTTLCKVLLERHADAVEFCPQLAWSHVLAAASYMLVEGPIQSRLGSLHLFAVESGEEGSLNLRQFYHRQTSGIFDVKWNSKSSIPWLAQATADGSITTYVLRNQDIDCTETQAVQVGSSMCLSVDWAPQTDVPCVAVSLADGFLSLVNLAVPAPVVQSSWQAHAFEAWVCSFDTWRPEVLYSGGDDCHFCAWDTRGPLVFRDKTSHGMGVCCIQSSPHREHVVVTGSYDEILRIWDMRMMQKALLKGHANMGGGVWKVKCHPKVDNLLLTACMHNGFSIVAMKEAGTRLEILQDYKEHSSLAYGADWFKGQVDDIFPANHVAEAGYKVASAAEERQRVSSLTNCESGTDVSSSANGIAKGKTQAHEVVAPGTEALIATCSFYDNLLHLWAPKAGLLINPCNF